MEIIEIYDNYVNLGITPRPITKGQEFDMVCDFITYKKEIFQPSDKRNLAIFIETKINDAYPDLIFTEYDPTFYEKWDKKRNTLTTIDLKLLHFIFSRRGVSSKTIIRNLSIQYRTLLQSLEALWDAKLIDRVDGKWVLLDRRNAFGVKRIEAVEAKISKWNEVMQQAIINKSFASESFVLSKRKRKPDADMVEKINSFGIGIYLYNSTQFCCYTNAKSNRFPSNYNSIYLNECIGRILNC